MDLAALVARPGLPVIHAKRFAPARNIRFRNQRVRSVNRDVRVSARRHRLRHGIYKFLAAIRVNIMVAKMVRHHHTFQAVALSNARGDGQHDAVTERHHRRFHIFVGVRPFGNRICARQQRRLEIIVHELERNREVFDSKFFAMELCKRNFTAIVVAAVIKRNGKRYLACTLVKQGRTVHSAGQDQQSVLHGVS